MGKRVDLVVLCLISLDVYMRDFKEVAYRTEILNKHKALLGFPPCFLVCVKLREEGIKEEKAVSTHT